MIKSQKGVAFRFVKYRISNFSYNESENNNEDYDIEFMPTGKYNELTGRFILKLVFTATDKDSKKIIIAATGISEYQFDDKYKLEELPAHFFLSATPIFFPYMRAFVSNLTLQANTGVLVLGLMNFTNMAEPLKENTTIENVEDID